MSKLAAVIALSILTTAASAQGWRVPSDEMTVVVPDLVQSQLRFIHLRKQ